MTAKILDGNVLAKVIKNELVAKVKHIVEQGKRSPGLAVVLVGNDHASKIYVTKKQQAAKEIGLLSQVITLPKTISQTELLNKIQILNKDPKIDGILVQLPLPKHIEVNTVLEHIAPHKDVDAFHPINFGKLAQGHPGFRSCTSYGIMLLLQETKVNLKGLHAVIVGASNIVGKPMLFELLQHDVTVTVCHKYTVDLKQQIQQADLIIVAVGKHDLIKGEWIKEGAIVIDVGMNRLDDGRLVGDVEFDEAQKKATWITPVPGGVGPMTIAVLLQNTLLAYYNPNF